MEKVGVMYKCLNRPLFFKKTNVCPNKTVVASAGRSTPRYYENNEVRVKDVVFKIHHYCSEYLYKDTKECIAYWNAIQAFNQEIEYVYHTIQHKESPYLCEEFFGDMDKMYDL